MYKKEDKSFEFTINKISYTMEYVNDDLIEIYETNNPATTGFVFNKGFKSFIPFINKITDITEDLIDEV